MKHDILSFRVNITRCEGMSCELLHTYSTSASASFFDRVVTPCNILPG